MALFSYMLGKSQKNQRPVSTCESKKRQKLQKPRTLSTSRKSTNVDTEFFDVFRAQSCLIIHSEENGPLETENPEPERETKCLPHIGTLLSPTSSISYDSDQSLSTSSHSPNSSISYDSNTSFSTSSHSPTSSISTLDSCLSLSLSTTSTATSPQIRLPRRAKTPIMFVGQLESAPRKPFVHLSSTPPSNPAEVFALQYSAILPPRSFTPCFEETHPQKPKPFRHSLRKIKCQSSLRELAHEHSSPRPSSSSDCETLIGSETPSPTRNEFPKIERLNLVAKPAPRPQVLAKKVSLELINQLHDEIGLGICMNMLTNELASAMFTPGAEERGSGLQIRLMIEAYETLQDHVQKEIYDALVEGEEVDSHVQEIEDILDRWLESLYAVYDISQGRCEVIREENDEENDEDWEGEVERDEDWPLRRSQDSAETYVSC